MNEDAEKLAEVVKDWRGRVSAREAADILGMPKRTLDGIEQARPFRYTKLLELALDSPKATKAIQKAIERKRQKREAKRKALEAVAAE